MNDETKQLDAFDSYVLNEMSPGDRHEFDVRLTLDEAFRESFENYQKAVNSIKIHSFSLEIEQIAAARKSEESPSNWKVYLSIAASILIVISSYLLLEPTFTNKSNVTLFDEYFVPYPNITAMRGEQNSDYQASALNFYSEGKYQKAIADFNQLEIKSDTIKFYQALCHLGLNEAQVALTLLSTIPENSIFTPQVNWYKCLALVEINNFDSLLIQLGSIKEGEYNYQRSVKLKQELNSQ